MTTETTSPDGGAMTREQVVAQIKAADAPAPVVAAEEPKAEPEAEADEPEQESEAAPTADDEGEQAEPAIADEDAEPADPETVIDYPRSWAAKDREVFATLPEEARTIILAREEQRDQAVSKAQQTAGEARRKADQEAAELLQFKPKIEGLIDKASKTLADRWDNIDWTAWAQQDPAAALSGKFQMEQEQADLASLTKAQQELTQKEIQKFANDEFAKLPEVAPDLVDPKEGQKRRTALATFLLDQGVSRDQLAHVSAAEMAIAYDAMRFRQMKAAPPTLKPTQTRPVTKPPAKPAATVARSPENELTRAQNRFAQTKSREDAVALIRLKGL